MAYLKAYYPKEFYCSVLDYLSPSSGKFKDTISEVRDLGVSLSCPSVNGSGLAFSVREGNLAFPISYVKGLQGALASSIVDERLQNGPYQDIFDFASRLKPYGLNLPSLIRLIDAGALDCLYPSRASLRASAPAAISYAEMIGGETGQEILLSLGIEKPRMVEAQDDMRKNLDAEYEALGMMVSGSPLSLYKDRLKSLGAVPLRDLPSQTGQFLTAGIVKNVRSIRTRKGDQMAFMDLYDDVAEASFTVFSDVYSKSFMALKSDAIILVRGRKSDRRDGYIADEVSGLEENQ